jgi:glycine dehydrogenase subunit 1
MFPYLPNTPKDEESMLKTIGVPSVDDLFNDINDNIKFKGRLNINHPMSEMEVSKELKSLANKNTSVEDTPCFLGAGAYDHYIPAAVHHITGRSEFYTAYTPYQAEISQGTLQVIFEYQSMICSLTHMDVANASMYDGGTAAAEAAFVSCDATRRKKILVSKTVNPDTRKVLKTYMRFRDVELIEIDSKDGVTDLDKLKELADKETAGVIVQNPNFLGIIEDYTQAEKIIHENKALLIMSVDPISLAILKSPGEIGADIAVGEGQSLGNSLNFGGPYLGFLAATSKVMRKIPGRIVGETTDLDGKRAFVLTLQAREQHIRRQKATSNICSNQQLCALSAAVYLTLMGKKGLIEVAESCIAKSHYAYNEIMKSGKYKDEFKKPFFMEFPVKANTPINDINDELIKNNIIGGYDLGKDYDEYDGNMLLCVTEKRSLDEINKLAAVLEGIK